MWKYTKACVNPRRRKYAFPHVEIHLRSCISACGNTPKVMASQRAEILIFLWISTCGNSSGKVNFRMSIYKWIREFPWGKTCGNTRCFGDFHMRKYTRKCKFPRAEIHTERCITASGNTLNQVFKKRPEKGYHPTKEKLHPNSSVNSSRSVNNSPYNFLSVSNFRLSARQHSSAFFSSAWSIFISALKCWRSSRRYSCMSLSQVQVDGLCSVCASLWVPVQVHMACSAVFSRPSPDASVLSWPRYYCLSYNSRRFFVSSFLIRIWELLMMTLRSLAMMIWGLYSWSWWCGPSDLGLPCSTD